MFRPCVPSHVSGIRTLKTSFSPCGRRGRGDAYRGRFFGSPCVPSLVLGFRTPRLPLLPLWEKGARGMRGKSTRECRKPHHHAGRSGVHRLFLVEQPAGCVECGLKARAPWLWRAARQSCPMWARNPRTLAIQAGCWGNRE